jgi:DNA-binding response OmpR family regulator
MTKILLVEDDKSLREIYGVRLLAEGYDIVSAGDGEEALAMAIKERPQLIVSDVMMPKISGFDMLDILRSTTETKNIKVIMMTALSSDDQRERGEQLGADRYLVKSQVGIEDVVRTVHEVLGDAPVAGSVFGQTQQPQSAPQQTQPQAQQTYPQSQAQAQTVATPQQSQPRQSPQSAMQQPQSAQPAGTTHFPPQPTAPFASPRPATLGERVIHPLESSRQEPSGEDLAARIASELNDALPTSPQAQPHNQPTPSVSSIPVTDDQSSREPQQPTAPIHNSATEPQSEPQQYQAPTEQVYSAPQSEQNAQTPQENSFGHDQQQPEHYPSNQPQR